MYVQSIHIVGLADLPELQLTGLERVVRIKGPSPEATAVGDALALAFSALSADGLSAFLRRLGFLQPEEQLEIEANPLPIQAAWEDRQMAPFLLADPNERRIQVTLELVPDPPLFAELRALGAKAPRLGAALGADPVMTLQVSAFFAASWDVLSLAIANFSVGDESFSTIGKERPEWLTTLLLRIGQRFWHHHPTGHCAEVATVAMTSADGQEHDGFMAWQEALKSDFGTVRPARGPAGAAMLLADGRPLRRFGRFGTERTELAASVFFSGSDILWAGQSDPWVDTFVEGEGSPLEQVWRIDPDGTSDPTATHSGTSRSVLSFSAPAAEE